MMSDGVPSSSTRAASAPAAATVFAHVPTETPYGGWAGSSRGARSLISSRPVWSSGSRARRSDEANSVSRAPAGASDAAAAEHERPLLDGVEQVVDGRLGVGGHDHRRAVPAVRDLGLDQRLGQRLAVGVRPLVETELDAGIVVGEGHGERAEQLLEAGEQLVDLRPPAPRARRPRRRPTRGRCRPRRAPRSARPAGRSTTRTRRSGP